MPRLKNSLKKLQERQFALTGILVVLLMLNARLPHRQIITLFMAENNLNIPYRQSTILLDGKITESSWRHASVIQLGTAQKSVKECCLYDKNFLYLGFHTTDLSLVPGKDCIRIVLNPYLGSQPIGDSLFLRFDIFLFATVTRNFVSAWDHSNNNWIQTRAPMLPPIWSEIYHDPLLNYWQVETKIDRNHLNLPTWNAGKFGIYMQVLDFSNDAEPCGYDWPAWSQMNMDDLIERPHQCRWAWAKLNPDPSRWNWLVDLNQVSD